jgi:hypothetical protein
MKLSACDLRSDGRNFSVAPGLSLAGNKDGRSSHPFAGLKGENVKDGVYRSVSDDNAQNYAGDGNKKKNESNQYPTQVRPLTGRCRSRKSGVVLRE